MITSIAKALKNPALTLDISVLEILADQGQNPVLMVGFEGATYAVELLPPAGWSTQSQEFFKTWKGEKLSVRTAADVVNHLAEEDGYCGATYDGCNCESCRAERNKWGFNKMMIGIIELGAKL